MRLLSRQFHGLIDRIRTYHGIESVACQNTLRHYKGEPKYQRSESFGRDRHAENTMRSEELVMAGNDTNVSRSQPTRLYSTRDQLLLSNFTQGEGLARGTFSGKFLGYLRHCVTLLETFLSTQIAEREPVEQYLSEARHTLHWPIKLANRGRSFTIHSCLCSIRTDCGGAMKLPDTAASWQGSVD